MSKMRAKNNVKPVGGLNKMTCENNELATAHQNHQSTVTFSMLTTHRQPSPKLPSAPDHPSTPPPPSARKPSEYKKRSRRK